MENANYEKSPKDYMGEQSAEDDLAAVTAKTLNDILMEDPLMCDLPKNVTLEEVNSQIALQQGQSITVFIDRHNETTVPVVVPQRGSTVLDLKRAFRRNMSLKLAREKIYTKISWRYVWKNNWLYFEGQKLKSDSDLLEDLGIWNKCHVSFIKRLREKGIKN
ncbi:U11/U12 small nuclear ribonucleoprotein 25 kDa protein-like [Schistocerca piceifrons]|uniref:U11/U12 small nuclear ribonucleoprotein 25 kDa protein-like n=1 Tax=Schistocerca piceifrons TaxID=274613 RepID=UPI001F5FE513|nr:U11/U12 small nuclear ribonucleoprotein 25 kDa protein-like [Schistocerca piceifrons]